MEGQAAFTGATANFQVPSRLNQPGQALLWVR